MWSSFSAGHLLLGTQPTQGDFSVNIQVLLQLDRGVVVLESFTTGSIKTENTETAKPQIHSTYSEPTAAGADQARFQLTPRMATC